MQRDKVDVSPTSTVRTDRALSRGPFCDLGVILLRPGDDYRNHYHAHSENSFFTLEGGHAVERLSGALHAPDRGLPPLRPAGDALLPQRGRDRLAGILRARAVRPERHDRRAVAPGRSPPPRPIPPDAETRS